jgi:hypothetical protein
VRGSRQGLVYAAPVNVEVSKLQMRDRIVRSELGCLSVGGNGSGAFGLLGVALTLPQEAEVGTLWGTQQKEQAGDQKRQGRKGDEWRSSRWTGHAIIIAAGRRVATANLG